MQRMNTNGESNVYLGSKRYSYFVFTLLFLLYMFDYVDRYVCVSMFPFLKDEWGLTDTHCGLLVSAVYWSIMIFTLPASLLIDRWSRKNLIGLMALLWSYATVVCAITKNFRQLFMARTAIGIGEAGYSPGGTAMISALFPQEKRAMVMGIWNSSIPLGSALGIAIGGVVATHWGWRHAFGLVAIPGLFVALLFFWVRDYKTVDLVKTAGSDSEGSAKQRMSVMDTLKEFIGTPSLVFTLFGFAGNTFVTISLMTWLPTYFHRTEGLAMDKAGLKGGMVMLPAIIGAPLGGYIADRWRKKHINARLHFSVLSSLLFAVVFFVAMSAEGIVQYAVMLLAGMVAVAFVPAAAAVTQDVVHPGLRATAYSLCVIMQHVLGSALGPVFVGAVSDKYDLHTALRVLPIFAVAASVLFLIGSRWYVRDMAKVEKVEMSYEG